MSASLNVIALVSGGKDSFFSILHCLANGHRLVALANLHPPEGGDEDINSFMYQTVGASLISLYGEALDVPLYRQEIRGSAVIHDRDYHEQKDDETEDLVPLLRLAMQHHPEANAVSTGAILSTYQRTRVESVALRLGLTPLSFLWQYPFLPPYLQSSLLSDMHAVGQHSNIIKVASGGLDESFLGVNVADPKTVSRMKRALGRFSENGDGALVGEGGEFETLVVDGPSLLWKRRLEIQGEGEVVRQEGGTATWKAAAKVVGKDLDTITLQVSTDLCSVRHGNSLAFRL
jgi:diphthine-ammonia ligase